MTSSTETVTDRHGRTSGSIPKTRISTTWIALATGMLALVVALIFILQNLRSVTVHFITLDWRIPLGIDLLFAVILGGLIILCAGSLRILQLRRLARRERRRHSAPSSAVVADVSEPTPTETELPTQG